MLKIMDDLPANVLGVYAEGKVTGADYKNILIPAVEEKFKTNMKLRFLYHLGSGFTGFELTALAEDTWIGMKHVSSWERIALVSDHKMIDIFVKFFGYMLPGKVRVFKDAELEEAKKWIMEK